MKSLILFTITSLLLFNNKAFPIAPPTSKLNISKDAVNPPPANNGSPSSFAVTPTKEVISQAFGIEPNNHNIFKQSEFAASMTTPTGITLPPYDLASKHPEACCNPFAVGLVTLPSNSSGANQYIDSRGEFKSQSETNAQ